MAFDEDRRAEAIAAQWGVDVSLLQKTDWEVETIDGNDDAIYGYLVRFDDETDPDILSELGLGPGEFTRQLSINTFDEPENGGFGVGVYGGGPYGGDDSMQGEADDGIYSIEDPLPDISEFIDDIDDIEKFPELPPGQAYLTDEHDRVLTDEEGRGLIVTVPEPSGAVGGTPLNEYVINGPMYAGASFAGATFAAGSALANEAESIRAPIDALRVEMLNRLDELEYIIRHGFDVTQNRGHNRPPELLEVERSVTQEQYQEVLAAIAEVRRESESPAPDAANVEAQVSIFRRIAKALAITVLGLGAFVAQEIASLEIGLAHAQYRQAVVEALGEASEAASAWVEGLKSMQ